MSDFISFLFSWTLLIAYFAIELNDQGNKASHCIRSFCPEVSDKYLPTRV